MTFEKIKTDMYAAMKAKDALRKEVLSTIMANAKNEAISSGADRENVPDAIVDAVLLKEKKLLRVMIDEFPKEATSAEHIKLKQTYNDKLAIVMEYAPNVIDDENEIRAIVVESGVPIEKKSMGKLMGMLKGKKCDMSVASKVVNKMIAESEAH